MNRVDLSSRPLKRRKLNVAQLIKKPALYRQDASGDIIVNTNRQAELAECKQCSNICLLNDNGYCLHCVENNIEKECIEEIDVDCTQENCSVCNAFTMNINRICDECLFNIHDDENLYSYSDDEEM